MKLTILVDNYVDSHKLKAEHGLSILIVADGEKILFDCGQSDLILSNAKVLGIELDEITKIVLSHAHYDHTGGLMHILKYLDREIDIYAHPLVFDGKFSQYKDFNSFSTNRYIGIPQGKEAYEKKGANFILSEGHLKLGDNIYFSGQINKEKKDETGDLFFTKDNNNFVKDPMHDDISIFIDLPEILVIVTGCAHSGILNILNKSKDLKLNKKNLAIIGGLHLSKRDNAYIDSIISEFKKYDIKLLVPMHCTGFNASVKLTNNFGKNCVIGSVGKSFKF